ncbi:hypothetical protein H5V44_02205 [Halobellus sp. MBLA0160]|uniref:Uncharacterized protein n=1 Tax=Halobellus ruber TaxID=2761102 RepID=A0A7J9SFH4_9EURY|nr:hypothetical protein [Halobellus ruber]
MSRIPLSAVAVAALLVLAGCGGVAPDDGTPTAEEASTATPEANLTDATFPEGFSESAVDAETARTQSLAFLRTESISVVALERFRPGAYADYQYEANATRARFRIDVHNGYSDVTESDVFVRSDVRYSRQLRDGRLSFDAADGSIGETRRRAATSLWAVLSRILTIGEFRAVRVSRGDGERRIRYSITGVVPREATEVRGYLVVDDDGVVREARLQYTQAGDAKRFEYAVRRSADGDVASPAWLPAARAAAGPPADSADGTGTTERLQSAR